MWPGRPALPRKPDVERGGCARRWRRVRPQVAAGAALEKAPLHGMGRVSERGSARPGEGWCRAAWVGVRARGAGHGVRGARIERFCFFFWAEERAGWDDLRRRQDES